ncbi:MAG: CDP-glycerol glycerophosphotransferase family protein [Mycoplasmatales bacterium]
MKVNINTRKKVLLIPSAGYKNVLGDILPIEKQLRDTFDCYIVVRDIDLNIKVINSIKYVKLNSSYYNYLVATSEYVFDCGQLQSTRKVFGGSCWVNLWHGIPIKKMMIDLPNFNLNNINNFRYFDYFVSSSKYYTDIIKHSFLYEGNILEIGTPRYDLAFKNINQVNKKELNIKENEKVILYAPTFRKKGTISIPFDVDKLEEAFGFPIKLIVKAHYLNELSTKSTKIIDMTNYESISDLFKISDIVISDYSSLIFDYALYNKPLILFHYDYEQYKKDRGLYFELSEYYNDIAYNEQELYLQISKIKSTDHKKFINKFLPNENGCSTDKLIKSLKMNDKKYDMKEIIFLVNQLDEIGGVHTYIKQTAKLLKKNHNVKIVVIATTKKYKTNISSIEFNSEYVDIKITDPKISRDYLKNTNGYIIGTQIYALKLFQNELKNKNVIAMFHGDVKFAETDKTIYNNEISDLSCCNIFNIKSLVLLSKSNTNYFKSILKNNLRVSTISNYITSQKQKINLSGNVIFISRLTNDDKNIFKLIDVAQEMKKLGCKKKIDIYGAGKDKQTLEQMIQKNNLEDILILKGYTNDAIGVIKKYSINLCLSNTEGLPYSILESASVGVPTICVDTFLSAKDIINKDLLVNKGNYKEIANIIHNISNDKELLLKYSDWAYKLSQSYYEDEILKLWKREFAAIEKISPNPKEQLIIKHNIVNLKSKIKNFVNSIVTLNFRHENTNKNSSSSKKLKSKIYFLLGESINILFGRYLRNKYFIKGSSGKIKSLTFVKGQIKEQEKVSIIVPCYNVEETIPKTINSLLKQTYKNIEIILINDGSTDKTKQIIESYSNRKIKCFTTKNSGLSLTRNKGLKESTGSYIMFVDGDDTIERNAIETLYYSAKFAKVNIVSGKTLRVSKRKFQIKRGKFWRKALFYTERVANVFEDNMIISDNLSTNKLYNANIFTKYNLKFKKIIYEDKVFTSELYHTGERILLLDKHIYNWYIYEHETISSTYELDNLMNRCESILKQLDIITNEELKTIVINKFLSHDMLIFQKVIYTFDKEQKEECFEIFRNFMHNKWEYVDINSFKSGFTYITSKLLKENRKKEYILVCEKIYNKGDNCAQN